MADTIWDKLLRKPSQPEANLLLSISVDLIKPNPYQPRRFFDEEELRELASSIQTHGILQPLVVTKSVDVDSEYTLVVGERRLRAASLAGLTEVPVVLRQYSEEELAEVALIENLQRKDLTPIEEALAYKELVEKFGITQQEVGLRVGKSQSAVANKLRLLTLPPDVLELISREIISERHARALLKLSSEQASLAAQQVVKAGLTVKQTECLVDQLLQEQQPKRKRIVRIFKDARLFRNSVLQLVKELRASGLAVDVTEEAQEEDYKLTINISKGNRGQS